MSTTAWFAITVPGGTPSFTRRSNVTTADWPADSVPALIAADVWRTRCFAGAMAAGFYGIVLTMSMTAHIVDILDDPVRAAE